MFNPLEKIKNSYTMFTKKKKSVDVNDIFPGQPVKETISSEELVPPSRVSSASNFVDDVQYTRPFSIQEKIAGALFDITEIINYRK